MCLFYSLQHLTASLDQLSSSLKESQGYPYNILKQSSLAKNPETGEVDPVRLEIMKKKGFFPYESFKSVDALFRMTEFPPIEAFYSTLSDSLLVTEEEYNYAKSVFATFELKNMLAYCVMYCLIDIYTLAECFSFYSDTIQDFCGLSPWNFLGTPSLSFAAFFKTSNVKLDLIQDRDMFMTIEQSLRGGLSYVCQRYAEASDTKKLLYLDKNALYSSCLLLPLPRAEFSFMDRADIDATDWRNVDPLVDGGYGYILEVDLTYPEHLHLEHADMPLAAEKVVITEDMFSPYTTDLHKTLKSKESYKEVKLTATFGPRKNYVCHLANLQYYLRKGMILDCIHKVIRFKQSTFAQEYIEKCTKARAASKFKYQMDRYKAMGNSVVGKLCENKRNRVNAKAVKSPAKALKLGSRPGLVKTRILKEDLVLFFTKEQEVLLDSNIAVSFTIYELSKLKVLQDFYEIFKPKFPTLRVGMSDTDSILMQVQSSDLVDDLGSIKDIMDFSNYHPQHPLFDLTNKKRLNMWKDECGGAIMTEFAGLRPKCYAYKVKPSEFHLEEGGDPGKTSETKLCKGVLRSAVKKDLTFDMYKQALFESQQFRCQYYKIAMKDDLVFTTRIVKIALNALDTKRFYLDCGVHSVPYNSIEISLFGSSQCWRCLGDEPPLALKQLSRNHNDIDDNHKSMDVDI